MYQLKFLWGRCVHSRSWLVSCQIFEILQTVSDLLNPGSWNKTGQAEEGKGSRDQASGLGIRGKSQIRVCCCKSGTRVVKAASKFA